MTNIPPTHRRKLKRIENDDTHQKRPNKYLNTSRHHSRSECLTEAISTVYIALQFIELIINQNDKEAKIKLIVQNIERLYQRVAFSSKTFIDFVYDNTPSIKQLLQAYYEVSTQLKVLALPIHMLLNAINELDEPLCELLLYHEDIGQAYIEALDEKAMTDFFVQDGTQFVDWRSTSMKRENVKRLQYILQHYSNTMKKDQCVSHLLGLNTKSTVEDLSKYYFKQLLRVKESILSPNKVPRPQLDATIIKTPVLKLISTWFFEFEPTSKLKLSDFALKIYKNAVETKQNVPDISLLLQVYNTACKQSSADESGIGLIPSMIESLNHAVVKSLEQDDAGGLAIILTFAQFTFEQMHELVEYSYVGWFDSCFIQSKSSILNKRQGIVFMNLLQQLISYELPSVLQVQGKALHHCSSLPNTDNYVLLAKKKLLELGVDASFKSFPFSLKTPLRNTIVEVEDEVSDYVQQFKKKQAIPNGLASAFLFRQQWYLYTFLPNLVAWDGGGSESNKVARDELVEVLREESVKKMPDSLYYEFLLNKKKYERK